MAFEPPIDRDRAEAFYTTRRLTELRLQPVVGDFSVDHHKEINRRIFQDLPGLGFRDVTPGEFRPPAPQGRDWVKHRSLLDEKLTTYVAYSPMDGPSKSRLADVLAGVDLPAMRKATTAGFSRQLANLYTELDYLHPFSDGNSRTLREFTRTLADSAGFDLRWATIGQSNNGRDVLYVARDLSVNRLAVDRVRNEDTRRDIQFTLDQLTGNRDLTALFLAAGPSFLRPKRAVAFERLDAAAAIPRFPELLPMYEQLSWADSEAARAFPDNAEARSKSLVLIRQRMQAALDAGELSVKPVARDLDPRPQLFEQDR